MKSRIMYIESKAGGLTGLARIGRVKFSKSGATVYYQGKAFQSLRVSGFKSNYFDVETGEHLDFWPTQGWPGQPLRDTRHARRRRRCRRGILDQDPRSSDTRQAHAPGGVGRRRVTLTVHKQTAVTVCFADGQLCDTLSITDQVT